VCGSIDDDELQATMRRSMERLRAKRARKPARCLIPYAGSPRLQRHG
jgi:hypothetical protein